MQEIGAFEAKNTLGSLLDRVQQGEEIVITRHGVPVARLVPNSGRRDPDQAQAALDRIRARAEKVRPIKTDEEDVVAVVKELAARQNRSLGEVISELSRYAFHEPAPAQASRNGVPLLPGSYRHPVTPELVNRLRDETP